MWRITLVQSAFLVLSVPLNCVKKMWRITLVQSAFLVLSVPLNCDGAVPPLFAESFKILVVPESASLGTVIGNITVTDADGDTLTLRLNDVNTRQYVRLNITENVGGRISAYVVLIKELDYENKNTIVLQFQADDVAYTSIGTIQIIVQDVNDNPPRFVNQPYLAQIPEDAVNGTTVFNATVFDKDETGLGSLMTVSLLTHTDLFHVTNEGSVTLISKLNYEQVPFYNVRLKVEDHGKPKFSSTAELFVTVTDVQNTPPYFTNLPYIPEILENHTVDSTVFKVSALDGDRGSPENISFSISSSTCPGFFSIESDGRIKLSKTADRDSGAISDNSGICVLTVKARETNRTGPLFEASRAVTITVKDLNDNSPTFRSTNMSATIRENMPAGVPVTFNTPLQVWDKDQAENAKITLSLSNYKEYFDLTPSKVLGSSVIQVKVTNSSLLDYETHQTLKLKLMAVETEASPPRSSSVQINLTILDANDNNPTFVETSYEMNILENSPNNTDVIQVNATDADSSKYGLDYYTIQGLQSTFAIDAHTGTIIVSNSKDLDRERQDTYRLTVEAVDKGGRRDSATVTIKLTDVNDNGPVFSRVEYTAYLVEGKRHFEREVKVEATDRDQAGTNNSDIWYSLSTIEPLHSSFFIDPITGLLTPKGLIDCKSLTSSTIFLEAIASDAGAPPQKRFVNVTINVQCKRHNSCLYNGPCQNGGTCTVGKDNTSTCHCPPGFTGAVCEKTDTGCKLREPILHCEVESSSGRLFRWCSKCEEGFYKLGIACEVCPRVHAGCSHVTCTSASQDLRCTSCYPGFFLNGDNCTECTSIPFDCAEYTCTGSGEYTCSRCKNGSLLIDGHCLSCPSLGIPDCVDVARDGCFKQWCNKCAPGFFIRGDVCDVCPTDDPGCQKTVCNSTSDSLCVQCFHGYDLIGGKCNRIKNNHLPSSSCSDSPTADCPSLEISHSICSDLSSACHLCPRYCDVCNYCGTP